MLYNCIDKAFIKHLRPNCSKIAELALIEVVEAAGTGASGRRRVACWCAPAQRACDCHRVIRTPGARAALSGMTLTRMRPHVLRWLMFFVAGCW